ncbi:WD40-repeat-containing domain protein [Irpex rosettiformis]|uniref:WD40-repeat-containing domain protein n=1 Tax=Irpex rosettiformis TaxID=378272 RepID=A0ACB8UI36_9APHY|nr:WD40-repeat-containing domain protein [Irpex rosettiformis]
MPYTRQSTLRIPAPVSSVSLSDNQLAVGSDDGSVRFYDLPSTRVTKAIRGLDGEIASVVWARRNQEPQEVWVANGPTAYRFSLDSSKMVLSNKDAIIQLLLGQDKEDVVNEVRVLIIWGSFSIHVSVDRQLSLSPNSKYLAFSTDAGTVGTIDLANQQVTRTKVSHTNICSSVEFIPDRPSEIVSGGYDSALLHFDFKQGSILSRLDIAAAPPTTGVSMSPPFVLSISVSPNGLVAATTADGRVWLGTGADKASPVAKKRRSRKWEGLREPDGIFAQVADGPIVASAFTAPATLVTCSLLGRISQHTVMYDEDFTARLDAAWTGSVTNLAKVNTLTASAEWVIVGGFSEDGRGTVELWREDDTASQ